MVMKENVQRIKHNGQIVTRKKLMIYLILEQNVQRIISYWIILMMHLVRLPGGHKRNTSPPKVADTNARNDEIYNVLQAHLSN